MLQFQMRKAIISGSGPSSFFLQHFWRLQGVRAFSSAFLPVGFPCCEASSNTVPDPIGEMLRHHPTALINKIKESESGEPTTWQRPRLFMQPEPKIVDVWSVIKKSPTDWIGSNQSASSFSSLLEMESNHKQQHITCFSWTAKDWPCFEKVQKIESTKHEVHPEPWKYWWEWIVSLLISWTWN